MDVREQLRTAPPGPTPSAEDARRIFERGRRRVVRRRVAGAGAALAVILVAVVVASPFGLPGSPVIEIAGPTDDPTTDPDPGRDTPGDPAEVEDPETVRVGQVVLTVPDEATLVRAGTGPQPCYAGIEGPTLVVHEAITPEAQPDCPAGAAAHTTLVAAPASAVPPALQPGHADVEDAADLTDVDLLGTPGVLERGNLADGTPVETYLFAELDLYLAVAAPDRTPGLTESLLASASRVAAATDGGSTDLGDAGPDDRTGSAPPLDGEASMDDRESPPDGPADLELVDVRVGTHAGFDRVVLELAGDGRVGWFMDLGDRAIEDGSGEVVHVDGDAVLSVAINALAFPPDLPDPVAWNGVRIPAPAGAGVLTEVVGSIWYEAQQQVFIGLDQAVAYRVERLDDPQRLVIDLVHP